MTNLRPFFAAIATGCALLSGCGTSGAENGVDEHGNAITARLKVVDSTGHPLDGSEIVIRPATWLPGDPLDSTSTAPNAVRIRTRADGSCEIPALRPGDYMARADHGPFAGMERVIWKQRDSATIAVGDVGAVRGRIPTAAPGTPVASLGMEQVGRTDSSGGFVLPFVAKGFHQIVAGHREHGTTIVNVEVAGLRATRIDSVPFDSLRSMEVQLRAVVEDVLLAPILSPPPGTYRDSVVVTARPLFKTDTVKLVVDASTAKTWSSAVVESSQCLQLTSIRPGARSSPLIVACYTITH